MISSARWLLYLLCSVILLGQNALCAEFYIDFEQGDDRNPGSRELPWKHHPWDLNADAVAKQTHGGHTYYFKKGVVYRGSLQARESGTAETPIVLTSEPSWGTGDALIYGSEALSDKWKSCTDAECGEIPDVSRPQTWYYDLHEKFEPRLLFALQEDRVMRLNIARSPNWKIRNPDNPRGEWWEWTHGKTQVKVWVQEAAQFNVGEQFYVVQKSRPGKKNHKRSSIGQNRILQKGKDWLLLEISDWQDLELAEGAEIGSKAFRASIRKIAPAQDVRVKMQDRVHLNQQDERFWLGATVWTEAEKAPFPLASTITHYLPQTAELVFNFRRPFHSNPRKFDRYFLENLPALLDAPNEWYFSAKEPHKHRIFVRLEKDRDPNTVDMEAARHLVFLDIDGQQHIRVSNLNIRFFNSVPYTTQEQSRNAPYYSTLFRITGQSKNISISHCDLSYASYGINIFPNGDSQILENFLLEHNKIYEMEGHAILAMAGRGLRLLKGETPKKCRIKRIHIQRNHIKNCGFRSMFMFSRSAINIRAAELVEVNHNSIDYVYGPGILVYNGEFFDDSGLEYPLNRTLIHHNTVTNSMLAGQDFGGIASWLAGPAYLYNNVSGNAIGYKHAQSKKDPRKGWYRRSSYAPALYLDHQYKGYLFNNIVWGKNKNERDPIYNSVAIHEAQGAMNSVFNNTLYRTAVGIHKGMREHNRCLYLNNLLLDINNHFIIHEMNPAFIEYDSLAYGKNIFVGEVDIFGKLGRQNFPSIESWRTFLTGKLVLEPQTGEVTQQQQVEHKSAHDFTPLKDSLAIDRAGKVFVPWGLYAVVGEWGFYKQKGRTERIMGEHLYWNSLWKNPNAAKNQVPRNDLIVVGANEESFRYGILEDWTKGALKFDGKSIYCVAEESELLDMQTNNFLIEAVLKIDEETVRGTILSKRAHNSGYRLQIQEQGTLRMSLFLEKKSCSRDSQARLNDGKWHHVIVEVDREKQEGIRFFIDGNASDGSWLGTFRQEDSLSNPADFIVGSGDDLQADLSMELDFLRISRGTLRDAETSIQELYEWQFNGPFLEDFYGNAAAGKGRDVGAIEGY